MSCNFMTGKGRIHKKLVCLLVMLMLYITFTLSFTAPVSAEPAWTRNWTVIGSTDSGGPANPWSIAADQAGNVYVTNENEIVKLANGSSAWQTLSKAGLSSNPDGIAVDKYGSLYITDCSNSLVQYLQSGTTEWLDIGGMYATQVWVPGERIYIGGENIWTKGYWAPSSANSGGIYFPYGVAVDDNLNVYIANPGEPDSMTYYNSVAKLQDGIWGIIGNNYNQDLPSYIADVAVDNESNVYVTTQYSSGTNMGQDTIRKLSGGSWSTIGQTGTNDPINPRAIAVDKWGHVYVVSEVEQAVKVFAEGQWKTISRNGLGGPQYPTDLAVDGSGNVYVTDATNNLIWKLQAPAAQLVWVTQPGDGVAGRIWEQPTAVALKDANGNVETDENTHTVTLTLNNAYGATIGGAAAKLINGVATFNNLTVNKAGSGYTLTPSCSLSPALSAESSSSFSMTAPAAPAVTGVSPVSGSGGTTVTIEGENLTAASMVEFGTAAGLNLVVNSDNSITVTAPAQGAGTVDVRVTTPGGTSISPVQFTYIQPGAWAGAWTTIGSAENGGFQYAAGISAGSGDSVYVVDNHGKFIKQLYGGHWYPTGLEGLKGPTGVAVDSSGSNIYVVDSFDDKIYRNGSVFYNFLSYDSNPWYGFDPTAVDVDSDGNVYIAGSAKVLKHNGSTWSEITYDGGFVNPQGIAVDTLGNVYVTDADRNFVKKLSAGASSWSAIGTGLNYPAGIAVDSLGNVYLADSGNHAVKELRIGMSEWNVIPASFNYPRDVAVDSSGNLYVAAGSQVLKHQPRATRLVWETEPGSGTAGTYLTPSPAVVLVDGNGNVVTEADGYTVTLELANPDGAVIYGAEADMVDGRATFDSLTVSKAGTYILTPSFSLPGINSINSDSFTMAAPPEPTVTGVSPASGPAGSTVTITGTCLTGALKVEFGDVAVMDPVVKSGTTLIITVPEQEAGTVDIKVTTPGGTSTTNDAAKFTYTTEVSGAFVGNWTMIGSFKDSSGNKYPTGMAVDDQLNVYVVDQFNFLMKWNGETWEDISEGAGFNNPNDVAVDKDRNIYVSDAINQRIMKKTPEGTWTLFANLTSPQGVAIDGSGVIYATGSGKVWKWNNNTSSWTDITYGSFSFPNAITVDSQDNVYVADNNLDAIKKLPAGSTEWTTIVSGIFDRDELYSSMNDVAVDSLGNIYVATSNMGSTWQLPAGSSQWRIICGAQNCLATDKNNNVYAANSSGQYFRHPAPATQLVWQTAPVGGAAGQAWAQQPVLCLADAKGNVASEVSGYVVTVGLTDPNAAVLGGTKTVTMTSGTATFSDLYVELAGSYILTPTINLQDIYMPPSSTFSITAGPVSAGQSTVTAVKAVVTADNTDSAAITVTLKDAYGNPVAGKNTALAKGSGSSSISPANAISDDEGKAAFTVKNTRAESVTYSVIDADSGLTIVQQTAQVNFEAGAADAANSTVSVNDTTVTADGADSATLTVTLKDAYGNLVSGRTVTVSQGSGSSVITPASAVSDSTGKSVFTVKNTKAETVTYTFTGYGVLLDQTVQVAFIPGAAEKFVLSALGIQKAGVPFNVAITAEDHYGNTAAGYRGTVQLVSTDAAAVLPLNYTFGSSDNGIYTFSGVLLKTAGLHTVTAVDADNGSVTGTTGNIMVAAGSDYDSMSTIAADKSTVTADGTDIAIITVTLRDDYGNLVGGKLVTLDQSDGSSVVEAVYGTSRIDGTAIFTAANTKAETVNYTAMVNGEAATEAVEVDFIPGAAESLIAEAAGSQNAGEPFGVTVTAKDHYGNTATGYRGTVQLVSTDAAAVLSGSHTYAEADNGTYTFSGVTLKTAGVQTVTAVDADNGSVTGTTGNITVDTGTDYTIKSTVAASKSVVTADGADSATITVTLKDDYDNLISNKVVTLSQDSGSSVVSAVYGTSLIDGTAVFTVASTKAEQVTYTAKVNGVAVNQTAEVAFIPGPAEVLVVSAAGTQKAGEPFGVAVTAKDHYDNTAAGYRGTVQLVSTDSKAVLPRSHTFAEADNGTYTFSGAIMKTAGAHTVTAIDIDSGSINGTTGNITVDAGSEYAGLSAIAADKSTVTADGTDSAIITVTLKDDYGNLISGEIVALSKDGGNSVVAAVYGTSQSDGTAVFTVKNTKAETVNYTAMADGESVTQAVEVTFIPGPAAQLAWKIQPGGGAGGQVWPKQPVLVLKDAYGNVNTGNSSSEITVELKESNGAILGGSNTVILRNGEAVFNDLRVDKRGNYKLTPTIDLEDIASQDSDTFRISLVPAPSIEPEGGTFLSSVTISIDYSEEFEAYYNLEGKDPTQDSIFYDGPFSIFSSSTVTAAVYDAVYGDWSSITTADFTIRLELPIANPADGSIIPNNSTVTLSSSKEGADIYYTTDGSTPNTGSPRGKSVIISGTPGSAVTVKAYAVKSGYGDSDVAVFRYTIQPQPVRNNDNDDKKEATPVKVPEPDKSVPVLETDAAGKVSITVTPKLDSSTGAASAEIDSVTLTNAFSASKTGEDGTKTVSLAIPKVNGAAAYETTLPANFLYSGDASKAVEIKTDIAAVTVPGNMLSTANSSTAQDVSLTVAAADRSKLDAELQAQIGNKPVIELNLKLDGQKVSWSNEAAPVTVSMAYTPTAEELMDPEHITVWYIDGSGNVISVPSGRYDPSTGRVTFTTTHFSKYAVIYLKKTFSDISSHDWARKPIEVLASKGIISNIGENRYFPAESITRADYLMALIRTLGLSADFEGNFDDIKSENVYYKEIGAARKLGITTGIGDNKFNPDAPISRQDMMVLTERTLSSLKKISQKGSSVELERFTDKDAIAAYAASSMAALIREGLIQGSGGKINPLSDTTRAEAAVFLYRIYKK